MQLVQSFMGNPILKPLGYKSMPWNFNEKISIGNFLNFLKHVTTQT